MTSTEFDYVIAGGGTAACVLARRLLDAAAGTVLILEHGPVDDDPRIFDPKSASDLFKSEFDYAYLTEPQVALNGRRVEWPRGRVLGGSSSTNLMIYVRGHRLDYDMWEYLGNYGWGWNDVLPLFKRSEDHSEGADEYHGVGGPLRVERVRNVTPLTEAFVAACQEVGLPRTDDFNGESMLGVGTIDTNIDLANGRRLSVAETFLRPVMGNPNLTVRTGATVDKVVFEGTRAVGVEYLVDGERVTVRAGREVILAGGTIGSPAMLIRSGVGPAAQLAGLGVPVVVDLPGVGENLHDHATTVTTWESPRPLPTPPGQKMDAMAFWSTDQRRVVPDLEPLFMHFPKPVPGYETPQYGFSIAPGIARNQSRGRLWLRSTDPFEAPALDPAYLTDRADLEAMADAIELVREIGHAKALDDWRVREVAPGSGRITDRASVVEWARETCGTYHHHVGTCKMGIDNLAVVDPELRVYGVEGLRVVDASIMPVIPTVNTHAPTIMVAEKASDLILGAVGLTVASNTTEVAA